VENPRKETNGWMDGLVDSEEGEEEGEERRSK
jgi:hypothetical protein